MSSRSMLRPIAASTRFANCATPPATPRARPLQDLHPRRGAPDHRRRLQCAAEDARGAAVPRRLHDGDHGAREHSADHPLALPALRLSCREFDDILAQLSSIADQEKLDAEDAALALLAEAGDGSMRDALSIMDQAIAQRPPVAGNAARLDATQIRELMGTVPNTVFERLLEWVGAGESAAVMTQIDSCLTRGTAPQRSRGRWSAICATR